MGEDVEARTFSRADRTRYREKVRRCLDVFARMLRESRFDTDAADDRAGDRAQPRRRARRPGAEERRGARGDRRPGLPDRARPVQHRDQRAAAAARRARSSPSSRTSCGPRLNDAEDKAARGRRAPGDDRHPADARRAATCAADDLTANPRYRLLSEQILAARGEDMSTRHRRAPSGCATTADSIVPEAACTSTQLHVQVGARRRSRRTGTPRRRSPASSSRSAPTRRSCSARSCGARPGSRCSSRPPTPAARSSRRRACGRGCGSASAGSTRSSTCSRRTCATSRRCCRSATTRTRAAVLDRGDPPQLSELRLHNGTIYRWNRPVYDVVQGRPHLRVENRVLPAGPTVADTLANAAFYFGLVRALAEDDRPLWTRMSFGAAEENFHAAARTGHRRARCTGRASARCPPPSWCCDGCCRWPTRGCERWGVDTERAGPAARHHRAAVPHRQQRRVVAGGDRAPARGAAPARPGPTRCGVMALRYAEHMHSNEPVHTWPVEG